MTISRIGIVPGTDGLPVISKAVMRGDTVYLCGVTPDPVGDVRTQTKQVLERVDRLLQATGDAGRDHGDCRAMITMTLPAALRGNGFPSQTGNAGGRR